MQTAPQPRASGIAAGYERTEAADAEAHVARMQAGRVCSAAKAVPGVWSSARGSMRQALTQGSACCRTSILG